MMSVLGGNMDSAPISLESILRHLFGGTLFDKFDKTHSFSDSIEVAQQYKAAMELVDEAVLGSRYPRPNGAVQFMKNHGLDGVLQLYEDDPDFRYALNDKLEDIELQRQKHGRHVKTMAAPALIKPDTPLTSLIYISNADSAALMDMLAKVNERSKKKPGKDKVVTYVHEEVVDRDNLARRQRKRGIQFVGGIHALLAELPCGTYEDPTFSPRIIFDREDYYHALIFNILPEKYKQEYPNNFREGLTWAAESRAAITKYPLDLLVFLPDPDKRGRKRAVDAHGTVVTFKTEESAARKAAQKLTNVFREYAGRDGKYTQWKTGNRDEFRIPLNKIGIYDMYRFSIVADQTNEKSQSTAIALIRQAFGDIELVRENASVGEKTSEALGKDAPLSTSRSGYSNWTNYTILGGEIKILDKRILSPIVIDFHQRDYSAEGNSEFSGPHSASLRRHQLHEGARQDESTKNLYRSIYQYFRGQLGDCFTTLRELFTQTNLQSLRPVQVGSLLKKKYLEVSELKRSYDSQLVSDVKAGQVRQKGFKRRPSLHKRDVSQISIPASVPTAVELAQNYTSLLYQYIIGFNRLFSEDIDSLFTWQPKTEAVTVSYSRPKVIDDVVALKAPILKLHGDMLQVNEIYTKDFGLITPYHGSKFKTFERIIESSIETAGFLRDAYSQIKRLEGSFKRKEYGEKFEEQFLRFFSMHISEKDSHSLRRLRREIAEKRSMRQQSLRGFEGAFEDSMSQQLKYAEFMIYNTALNDFIAVGSKVTKVIDQTDQSEIVTEYLSAARDFYTSANDAYNRLKTETLANRPLLRPDVTATYERNMETFSSLISKMSSVR